MKCIINYFKRKKEERLRAKIALNTSYGVNDLNTVYEFVKGDSVPSESKLNFTDKFDTTIDGGLIATLVDGRMTSIDGSFRDNTKNL